MVFKAWLVFQEVSALDKGIVSDFEECARLFHHSVAGRSSKFLESGAIVVGAWCEELSRSSAPLAVLFESVRSRQASFPTQLSIFRCIPELNDAALISFLW